MSVANELAALFRRDLTRLLQEIEASPEGELWGTLPGTGNSIGNLALHLEGNLREFIGRQLGAVPYQRVRDREFADRDVSKEELTRRLGEVSDLIPGVVAALSPAQMEAIYPEQVLGASLPTQQFLISLFGHLNYHLGQVDYLRRILTQGSAIDFAGLR